MTRAELLVYKDALQEDRHLRVGQGPYVLILIQGQELPGWSFGGRVFTRAGWVDETLMALERPPEEWELGRTDGVVFTFRCTCSYDDSEEMTSHAPLCLSQGQLFNPLAGWEQRFWSTFNAALCIGLGLLPSRFGQLDPEGKVPTAWPVPPDEGWPWTRGNDELTLAVWQQFSAFLESPEADRFRSPSGRWDHDDVCSRCGGECEPPERQCQLCSTAYMLRLYAEDAEAQS